MRASKTQRGRYRVGRGEYDGKLCDMVNAALRVTETPGSCRIHSDEYDVNEDAGGEDDSKYDVATIRVSKTRQER